MIGQLRGTLLDCTPGQVVLDVTGVGYEVQIPLSTFFALSGGAGTDVRLHVHTHVREDALQLYGFASRDERAVFELLIGISGVGPRMALAILSGIGVEELREAVHGQDRGRLQQIPGIGKKTAERLLLELRDKMGTGTAKEEAGAPHAGPGGRRGSEAAGLQADAISALVNLGYSRDVAGRTVARAQDTLGPGVTLESLLRDALAGLVR